MKVSKPLLKWVGGKTQIITQLLSEFPIEMNNYREIFLGGGSVLLALLSYAKNGNIKINGNVYAYDLNEALIHVYKHIQSSPGELYEILQSIIVEFNSCNEGEINRNPQTLEEAIIARENYYYWSRKKYNEMDKKSIEGSAMFIFLNKTCFRGVFRVGPKGFNVPYGNNKNPKIIDKEHLYEIHQLIQGVVFECCSFEDSMKMAEPDDFVYLDPPYAPETATSFVGYTLNGFNIKDHNTLFQLIHLAKCKLMLSNADVTLVRENFREYKTISILCKRSINSKNPESKAKEVIIKN